MSIVVNKITVEGRSIFIRSNPTTGIIALTSFVDDSSGESGPVNFTKSFRYSVNGIMFSEWSTLTAINIKSIAVTQKDTLVIELQYFKNEPPGVNDLQVTSATIGTTDNPILPGYYFKNSIFANYFGTEDVSVLNWYINVLDKLYQRGLIPDYIDRLNDQGKPNDFIEFWRGICKFFAYYVTYARKFQNFSQSDVLLSEYLDQRGLRVSPENDLGDLNTLMEQFYNQIFKRGTIHITDKKENGAGVDGELLRLIYYKPTDEFIFNLNKPEHFGWNIGKSSPLYRGCRIHDNANKFYEPSVEPVEITKYPTTGTASIVTDGGRRVLNITNGSIYDASGAKKIKVDEFMDYELFFMIKKTTGNNLTVGFDAFDKDGNALNLVSRKDGTTLNNYFVNKSLQRNDKYLGVSLILYNKLKPLSDTDNLNLKMVEGVAYVVPKIQVTGGGINMKLYNIRFSPMRTNYSKGFLQVNNWIDIWLKNNNNEFTIKEVKKYIEHYLVPYTTHLEVVKTSQAGDYSLEEEPDTFYWVGGTPYCQRNIWIPTAPSCETTSVYWLPDEGTATCVTA